MWYPPGQSALLGHLSQDVLVYDILYLFIEQYTHLN
jgi:hypothetical protein